MTIETYLLYLAALAVFFATPPDTSQLLIIANSARHGLKKSGWTIAGDLTANALQMCAAAFGIAAVIAASATVFQNARPVASRKRSQPLQWPRIRTAAGAVPD